MHRALARIASRSGSQDVDENDANPGLPLFNANSGDTEVAKTNNFRKMFSWGQRLSKTQSSDDRDGAGGSRDDDADRLLRKRSSLVPPNYSPIFHKRYIPLMLFSRKAHWSAQVVSFADNGIKLELQNMYSIFESMEQRPLMLTIADISMFYDWLGTFSIILSNLFDLEELCLYDWIEGKDQMTEEQRKWEEAPARITGELSESRRKRRKGELLVLIVCINDCRGSFEGRPVMEGLPQLADRVEKFVAELLAYLELKHEITTKHIMKRLRPKDRIRFERKYWSEAQQVHCPELTIVAATRWMGRRELRRWKSKYLVGIGKANYELWKESFNLQHYSLVEKFEKSVKQAEEERMIQIQDNDMARARAQPLETVACSDSEGGSLTSTSCASSIRASFVAPPTSGPPLA